MRRNKPANKADFELKQGYAGDARPSAPPPAPKRKMKINPEAVAFSGVKGKELPLATFGFSPEQAFSLPTVPQGVIPKNSKLAMDSAFTPYQEFGYDSIFAEGLGFLGYSYLAQLSQRAEYRKPAEIIAEYMTKNWLEFKGIGDEDKTEKIKQLEDEFKRLHVKDVFAKAAELDCYYGRSQIFIDVGEKDPTELESKLAILPAKIKKNGIKKLKVIEPYWTYPNGYNSTNPLADDFFVPTSWFVMSQSIHTTRFLNFVARPVSDILKPVYNFGGLSLTQILKPYVDNWLRTRQSVSDLLYSFSINVLKTNMDSILTGGGGEDVGSRVDIFNKYRDNRGCFVIDKDAEDFINVSAPLGTIDKLQAQSQEQMASVAGIPLIIFLKITPSGLNASSEGEIRTFNDWIESQQVSLFSPQMDRLLPMIQLSLWGEIDKDITYKWITLNPKDEIADANRRKVEAETDAVYIQEGVIDTIESRTRLAKQEDSPYAGLDLSIVPEPPQGTEEGVDEDDLLGGLTGVEENTSMDENKWITVHPNGENETGQPALIDGESGKVKGGMGGKFTGEKISEAHTNNPELKAKPKVEQTKITTEQSDALTTYSGSRYETINSGLRTGKLSSEDKKTIALIDSAMQATKQDFEAFENQELYRAADIPEIKQALSSGKSLEGIEFSDNGFVSTTKNKEHAKVFKRGDSDLFVFHAPKGTPAIDMADHSGFGDKEGEVLLDRGMKYKVRNVEVVKEKTNTRGLGGKIITKTVKQTYIHVDVMSK